MRSAAKSASSRRRNAAIERAPRVRGFLDHDDEIAATPSGSRGPEPRDAREMQARPTAPTWSTPTRKDRLVGGAGSHFKRKVHRASIVHVRLHFTVMRRRGRGGRRVPPASMGRRTRHDLICERKDRVDMCRCPVRLAQAPDRRPARAAKRGRSARASARWRKRSSPGARAPSPPRSADNSARYEIAGRTVSRSSSARPRRAAARRSSGRPRDGSWKSSPRIRRKPHVVGGAVQRYGAARQGRSPALLMAMWSRAGPDGSTR